MNQKVSVQLKRGEQAAAFGFNKEVNLMFEFHGWVNIKADDSDDPDLDILDARLNGPTDQIQSEINRCEWPNCKFNIYRALRR